MKKCRHCKKFDLTPQEAKMLKLVKESGHIGLTSSESKKSWRGKSISHISNLLKRLSDAGLIDREMKTSESGGIEYRHYGFKL